MTVKELIEQLNKIDSSLPICGPLAQPIVGIEEYSDCVVILLDESEGI
jgi:hypothetical protein